MTKHGFLWLLKMGAATIIRIRKLPHCDHFIELDFIRAGTYTNEFDGYQFKKQQNIFKFRELIARSTKVGELIHRDFSVRTKNNSLDDSKNFSKFIEKCSGYIVVVSLTKKLV